MGRKDIDRLGEFIKTYKAKGLTYIQLKDGEIKSPISKFLSEEEMSKIISRMDAEAGDLVLIVADKNEIVLKSLGALRLDLAKKTGMLDNVEKFRFAWVTEFPLLEYDEEQGRYVLVGIRQAGKSYLLYQRMQQLLAQGIQWDEMLYLNFEDERLTGMMAEDLNLLLEARGFQ